MSSRGSGFFQRVAARSDATVVAIRNALVRQIPGYGTQTPAERATLLHEVHETWRPVMHRAALDQPLQDEDLSVYRALARTRAIRGFPFADFRAGFEVAHNAGLRECLALADQGDADRSVAFTAWGVRELPRVLEAVTQSYLDAYRETGPRAAARELMLEALLAGRAPESPPSAGHLVLLFRPRKEEAPAGRPEQHAVERVLRDVPGLLWRGGPVAGRLLVLQPVAGEVAVARNVAADLTLSLAGAWRRRLHASEAHGATAAQVPEAVREAQGNLELVSAMPDARRRPYRADELLVELAVARQPDVRCRLARLVEPLRTGPDLHRTLEVLFDSELDRQRTAEALHLHRRSLTYRLRRIRELTGFDPATPHGIQVLRAALSATRLPGRPPAE